MNKKSEMNTASARKNESNSDSGIESASESEIGDTDEDSSTEEEDLLTSLLQSRVIPHVLMHSQQSCWKMSQGAQNSWGEYHQKQK